MGRAWSLLFAGGLAFVLATSFPQTASARCGVGDSFCVLHVFQGPPNDGEFPEGGLVFDANSNLVGTTFGEVGGQPGPGKYCGRSCGGSYAFDKHGFAKRKYFHFFQGGQRDGAFPTGELFVDSVGGLYGTTEFGPGNNCGGLGCGTVFRLASDGTEKNHVFCKLANCADGAWPLGGVTSDASKTTFYGTTSLGGKGQGWLCGSSVGGCGTIYSATEGKQALRATVLYPFCLQAGCSDGANPVGSLILRSGNLYGTTEFGGANGRGTIFELVSNGDGFWTEQVLYSFCNLQDCTDGAVPEAGLFVDDNGNFYGTTTYGGGPSCNNALGCGVVFRLDAANNFTVLHEFAGFPNDGALPRGPVTVDHNGVIYGATERGGSGTICPQDGAGCGTVFEIKPPYGIAEYNLLHTFAGPSDGAHPIGAVVLDSQTSPQYLYGVTRLLKTGDDTQCKCGTIYRIKIAD